VTGSANISAPATGTSGSLLFSVNGISGQLFSIVDSLSGSLFSVNDISGLPILEVFDTNTVLLGSYASPSLNTTVKTTGVTGTTDIYSINASLYNGAFVEYVVSSGSNVRSGNVVSAWDGSSIVYSETSTAEIGNTSPISILFGLTGGNAVLRSSSTTTGWTIKTIIRSI